MKNLSDKVAGFIGVRGGASVATYHWRLVDDLFRAYDAVKLDSSPGEDVRMYTYREINWMVKDQIEVLCRGA